MEEDRPPLVAFILLSLLVAVLISLFWQSAQAQQVEIKGTSSAILSGKCLRDNNVRGKRDKETFAKTSESKGQLSKRHVANSGIAVANAYDAKQAEIASTIDDFILNPNIRVICERARRICKSPSLESSINPRLTEPSPSTKWRSKIDQD